MPLNTILGPVKIDADFVFGFPHITALSNGSFAVTYLDVVGPNSVTWQVFDAQGNGVAGGTTSCGAPPRTAQCP
jgi:hypothetical protein